MLQPYKTLDTASITSTIPDTQSQFEMWSLLVSLGMWSPRIAVLIKARRISNDISWSMYILHL